MEKIVLIGGNTIDYIATSKNKLIKKTSNIGSLSISLGGVMRNICINLANLGMKCYFFTCIGSDLYGRMMQDDLVKHNIEVFTPKIENFNNASYICINDSNHDMEDAIIDNEIMEKLTVDYLLDNKNIFDNSKYLVMDTNLDEDKIDRIFKEFKDKKIIVEAISRSKVNRIKSHLKDIYLLKCNIFEARTLLNDEISSSDVLLDKFINLGVKKLILSQGGDSILFIDNFKKGEVKIIKEENIVNTTGCGDALIAGIIYKIVNNFSLEEGIKFGREMAKITLHSKEATSEKVMELVK